MALDWDILNDDCSDISGWADNDAVDGVSEQVTYDGRSTFRFYTLATNGTIARRTKILTVPNTFTLEVVTNTYKHSGFGVLFSIHTTDKYRYALRVNSNSVMLYKSATEPQYAAVFVVPNTIADSFLFEWITARLVVKADRKADLWVNNQCCLSNIACTWSSDTVSNLMEVYATNNAAATGGSGEYYVDSIKVDTTPEGQSTQGPVNLNGVVLNTRLAHETSWSSGSSSFEYYQSKLRIRAKDILGATRTCEIPLVATDDANASPVRIYNGSAVKSLQKLPT